MRTRLAFTLIVVAAAVAVASTGACGGPTPGECGEGEGENEGFGPTLDGAAAPADDGALPLNGILHVAAKNRDVPVTATLRLDDGVDDEHPATVDEIGPVLRVLLDGLVADTSDVAALRIDPAQAAVGAETFRELRFTTTAAADDAPPVFAGDAHVDAARVPAEGACGGEGTLVNVTAPAIDDDVGVAGVKTLAVNDDGSRSLVAFAVGAGVSGGVVASFEIGIAPSFELVAVDLAGNESAPLAFTP